MKSSEEKRIFNEAINGYGFVEVIQRPDGLYCDGCHMIHKRPTKMYTCRQDEYLCRFQVIQLYNPELPDIGVDSGYNYLD